MDLCLTGKGLKVKVSQSCLTLGDPMDYTVHGILQTRIPEWAAYPFSKDLPNPGREPRSPALQVYSLPAEPQGKPKNTGGGSLSLLQRIFPTQGSNPGLPHCRQILYQLSHKMTQTEPLGLSAPSEKELESAVGGEQRQGDRSPLPDRTPTTALTCPPSAIGGAQPGPLRGTAAKRGTQWLFWKKAGVNTNTLCEEA